MLYSARLSDIMAHFVFKKAKAFQLAQQLPQKLIPAWSWL